jgi:tRNA nucleotidyltransferase (CCA-adding enzyme)
MADYIYLLESRLSQAQQRAILAVREIARSKGLTVFLVGGAVRDLTSGSPVRDLDVVVQGNALKLQKYIEKAGGVVTGENEPGQSLFVSFPGGVRMEIGSTLSVVYPKPGKPVVKAANILDDLRRRDFTANAMALSLNEGSFGLLMDPLNGVADIENRELRLVSNYGFIEDPVRMIRAARYSARLGWQMEEKTKARYETGKAEGYISALSSFFRGYELEEIAHEEDPLRVMRGLEHEGWMKLLSPTWTAAKANAAELEKLREAQMQLQMRGIAADASAAQFPLLTAKMAPKDVAVLKKSFPRQGFVKEIDALEGAGKKFAAEFSAKQAATPSAAWKMLLAAPPEAVLWVAYSTKNAGLQAKLKGFYTEWPQARQKVPYTQMQEMRIVPSLAGYDELVEKIFFELMDGKLGTPEEMKAFLEPYSPPAPPPPVHLRRARVAKKEPKVAKSRKKVVVEEVTALEGAVPAQVEAAGVAAAAGKSVAEKAKVAAPAKTAVPAKAPAPVKASAKKVAVAVKPGSAKTADKKAAPVKASVKPAAKKTAPKKLAAKKAPVKVVAKSAVKKVSAKAKPKVAAKPQTKSGGKASAKAKTKPVAKVVAKSSGKSGKKVAVKPPAKKVAKKKR